MNVKRLSHVVFAVFAILLLGSMSAFAAPKPVPVQTPLSPLKIPQFVQPLNVLDLTGASQLPVALGTNITVNICEFQANMLPPGTPLVTPILEPTTGAPLTYVWGYQVDPAGGATICNPLPGVYAPAVGVIPAQTGQSYLGPVVVAGRGTPTQLTMVNKLPSAEIAKVKAYTTSTDQTLIWGDPLGLDAFPPPTLFNIARTQHVLERGAETGASRADARRLQQQLRFPGAPDGSAGAAPAALCRSRADSRRGAHPRRRGAVGARWRPRLLVDGDRNHRTRLLHAAREGPAGPARGAAGAPGDGCGAAGASGPRCWAAGDACNAGGPAGAARSSLSA